MYDRAVSRWLPAPPDALSPDGLSFAYAEYDVPAAGTAGDLTNTGRVHLADAASGVDRILFNGSPTYAVVGFTRDGIYLAQVAVTPDGEFRSGLFLLKPAGGTPKPVAGGTRTLDRSGWEVAGGAAWGTDYSSGGGIQPGNQLVRLDLKTGAVQPWLTRPEGNGVGFVGFDLQGDPIAVVFWSGYSSTGSPAPPQPTEVLILSTPDVGKVVYESSDPSAWFPRGPAYADSHGVWLSGNAGSVLLNTPQSGLRSVPVPSNGAAVSVAGTCQ